MKDILADIYRKEVGEFICLHGSTNPTDQLSSQPYSTLQYTDLNKSEPSAEYNSDKVLTEPEKPCTVYMETDSEFTFPDQVYSESDQAYSEPKNEYSPLAHPVIEYPQPLSECTEPTEEDNPPLKEYIFNEVRGQIYCVSEDAVQCSNDGQHKDIPETSTFNNPRYKNTANQNAKLARIFLFFLSKIPHFSRLIVFVITDFST